MFAYIYFDLSVCRWYIPLTTSVCSDIADLEPAVRIWDVDHHYEISPNHTTQWTSDHDWLSRTHNTINTLRPRQHCRHFPDDIFKCIFLNENIWISIKISLKFVPKGPINNIPALASLGLNELMQSTFHEVGCGGIHGSPLIRGNVCHPYYDLL